MENNWRQPNQGGEPPMDNSDWRTQLQADSRHRIVNRIMETLKRHLPFSGQEGLQELKKIAVSFEEKIYTAATSQSDYLRKMALKMLTMENKSNPMPNPMQSNSAGNSRNSPDPGPYCIDNNEEGEGDDDDVEGLTMKEICSMIEELTEEGRHYIFHDDEPKSAKISQTSVLHEFLWSEGGNSNDLGDEVTGKEAIHADDTTFGEISLTLELSSNETTKLHLPSDHESAIESVTEKSYAAFWTTGAADQKELNVLVAEKNNVAAVTYSETTCREQTSEKQRSCNFDPGPLLLRNQPIPEPVETEIEDVQSEEMNEEDATLDIGMTTGLLETTPISEHHEMELFDDSNTVETHIADESNVFVADQNNVGPTVVGEMETFDGEHGTDELSLCDPKEYVSKELDCDGNRCGVRTKGLQVAIAEETSASVASSRRKKSRRAENTDKVYRVKDIPIRREGLLELVHLKREEAAKSLGIKKTSFQNACRHFGIMTWPPKDIGNNVASTFDVNNVNEKQVVAKKRKKVNSSMCSDLLLINTAHSTANVTPEKDGETIATYLSYKDDTFVFRFPVLSSLPHIREKLRKRCSLNEGLFDIKYRDNKSKLISIVVEDDLKEFITTLRSLGEKSPDIELMVLPISNQLP